MWKSGISICLIVLPGYVFGYYGKTIEMGLAIVSGSIAVAFLNMDKVHRFKGAGFEAEMKAEVTKVVNEAYATIEHLKNLGKPVITALLKLLVTYNRFSGMKSTDEHKLLDDLNDIAKTLNIMDDIEIIKSREEFFYLRTQDHIGHFQSAVNSDLKDSPECVTIVTALYQMRDKSPTAEELLEVIKPYTDKLTHETLERLKDYKYYIANKKLRRQNSLE